MPTTTGKLLSGHVFEIESNCGTISFPGTGRQSYIYYLGVRGRKVPESFSVCRDEVFKGDIVVAAQTPDLEQSVTAQVDQYSDTIPSSLNSLSFSSEDFRS